MRRRTTAPFNGPFVHLNGVSLFFLYNVAVDLFRIPKELQSWTKVLGQTQLPVISRLQVRLKEILVPPSMPRYNLLWPCPERNSQINIALADGGERTMHKIVQVKFHMRRNRMFELLFKILNFVPRSFFRIVVVNCSRTISVFHWLFTGIVWIILLSVRNTLPATKDFMRKILQDFNDFHYLS